MRWMVTEFVAKLATKNATTSTQKTAIRADARSVRPGPRPSARSAPGVPDPRRGAGRSMSAWSGMRSEEHTSELQSRLHLVCRLLLEKKKKEHIDTVDPLSHRTGYTYVWRLARALRDGAYVQ